MIGAEDFADVEYISSMDNAGCVPFRPDISIHLGRDGDVGDIWVALSLCAGGVIICPSGCLQTCAGD